MPAALAKSKSFHDKQIVESIDHSVVLEYTCSCSLSLVSTDLITQILSRDIEKRVLRHYGLADMASTFPTLYSQVYFVY